MVVTRTHTPAWFYCFGSLAAPRLSTPFPAVPGSHHPPRRPPFILPWGWTTRLYDLPPLLARLAHTEVVNLHPALCLASLCLSRSLPTSIQLLLFHLLFLFPRSRSLSLSLPLPLLSLSLYLSLSVFLPRSTLALVRPACFHRHLPPPSARVRLPSTSRADTSNAPALSHRLSDTHARHRYRARWI